MAASSNGDITVVIACFNYGAYLEGAVASVQRQDGGSAHVIVVDDGSTDSITHQVLDQIERGGEVTVVRQANAGTSAARNAGLRRVETPYALVLDADDVLTANALATLRAALESDPGAGYAYGHIEFFGDASGIMRMPPFDPWRLMFRHIIGSTALMRRGLVEATGGYDPDFIQYEDWEFWLHALALGWRGRQVDFPALLARRHGPSKFAADRPHYREFFAQLQAKHHVLYGDLERMAAESELGAVERWLYRRVWGPRPWPARAETALYSVLWHARRPAPAVPPDLSG